MGRRLVLAIAGDVVRAGAGGAALGGGDAAGPLGGVARGLRGADVAFASLGCAVAAGRDAEEGPRAPARLAEALRRGGFAAVSLAGDHALDVGAAGLAETCAALDAVGVAHTGAGPDLARAAAPVRLVRAGRRVSLLAFALGPAAHAAGPSAPGIRYVAPDAAGAERARAAVVAERPHADVLVVALRGAAAGRGGVDPGARALALRLLAAGADVVWGHGGGAVQGAEWVGGRLLLHDVGVPAGPERAGELGAVFLVEVGPGGVEAVEVRPIPGGEGRAEPAAGPEVDRWLARFAARCASLGTPVAVGEGRARLVAPVLAEV